MPGRPTLTANNSRPELAGFAGPDRPVWRSGLLMLVLVLLFSRVVTAAEIVDRPNIILIFADDLGWKDVGYQGTDFYETPRIDRLASEGMVFTNGYAAAGNCAPSRACLLSGSYTPRHHVYAVGSTDRGRKELQRLVPIPNRGGLPQNLVTVADALRAAGYATGHFGKWHLGGREGARPTEQGFDESFDSFGEGEVAEGSEGNKAGPPADPKGVYTLTNRAIEFIERHRDRPFFCYLAHHAIHTPLQGRPETLARFTAKPAGEQHSKPLYAACTYDLDDSVGRLLDRLDELDLGQNTFIVFTSDNGGTQASSQEPLRGNKGCYYEGGIREPFIVRWPGQVVAGSRCDTPVINVDLFPTFLDLAGVSDERRQEIMRDQPLDGESLRPLFMQSGELRRPAIFWHFPGYLDAPVIRGRDPDFRTRPVSVIRQGDWKLHLYLEEWQLDGGREQLPTNNAVELYNMRDDIGEHHNLAAERPERRDELLNNLLEWHAAVDAQLPSNTNPRYAPDRRPKGKGKRKQGDN
ncbi:MAG: sulfatase [Planctomycetaceae bacterium]